MIYENIEQLLNKKFIVPSLSDKTIYTIKKHEGNGGISKVFWGSGVSSSMVYPNHFILNSINTGIWKIIETKDIQDD